MTYTALRANLASTMDRVCNDHEALVITRNGAPAVVMLSLEDYQALEETAYLLRTPLTQSPRHFNEAKRQIHQNGERRS